MLGKPVQIFQAALTVKEKCLMIQTENNIFRDQERKKAMDGATMFIQVTTEKQ